MRDRHDGVSGGSASYGETHKKHFNPISAPQAGGEFVLVMSYNRFLLLKRMYHKAQAKLYWNREEQPKSQVVGLLRGALESLVR